MLQKALEKYFESTPKKLIILLILKIKLDNLFSSNQSLQDILSSRFILGKTQNDGRISLYIRNHIPSKFLPDIKPEAGV